MFRLALLQLSAAELQGTAALFTVLLAAVHVIGGRLGADDGRRRRWLSAASGVSVAYVFVLLLPEVSEAALTAGELRGEAFLAEQLVYLLALLGPPTSVPIASSQRPRRSNTEPAVDSVVVG